METYLSTRQTVEMRKFARVAYMQPTPLYPMRRWRIPPNTGCTLFTALSTPATEPTLSPELDSSPILLSLRFCVHLLMLPTQTTAYCRLRSAPAAQCLCSYPASVFLVDPSTAFPNRRSPNVHMGSPTYLKYVPVYILLPPFPTTPFRPQMSYPYPSMFLHRPLGFLRLPSIHRINSTSFHAHRPCHFLRACRLFFASLTLPC